MTAVTPHDLRLAYQKNVFTFGNPDAAQRVCLVGSCRITPILNFFRAYNDVHGGVFEIICLNPIECWEGPGTSVADGVRGRFGGYRIGEVDFLVCEHMVNCGMMNTLRSESQNVFSSLVCIPSATVRLPNWNCMHIYDAETAGFDPEYSALDPSVRVGALREETARHKERFLGYCRECSFPWIMEWVEENWLNTRLGWTNSHVTLALAWKTFEGIAQMMGIEIRPAMRSHPLCLLDTFEPGHTVLNKVDYEANGWKF
jgi:hypothetical protein